MKQSPSWEAKQFLASQEIPCILWNSNVHYRIHKRPPTVLIIRQINPFFLIQFLKIHFNIFLLSKPGSSKWCPSLRFPQQNHVYAPPIPHTCYTPHPPHYTWFYHPNYIGWAVQIIKLQIMSNKKSSALIFRTSRSGSDVPYSFHYNPSSFIFPIFVHSWRFSVFHSLQSITSRTYVNWRHQYICLIRN